MDDLLCGRPDCPAVFGHRYDATSLGGGRVELLMMFRRVRTVDGVGEYAVSERFRRTGRVSRRPLVLVDGNRAWDMLPDVTIPLPAVVACPLCKTRQSVPDERCRQEQEAAATLSA